LVWDSAIAKGRSLQLIERRQGSARRTRIVTAENAGKLGKGNYNTAKLLGGPEIEHYHKRSRLSSLRLSNRRVLLRKLVSCQV